MTKRKEPTLTKGEAKVVYNHGHETSHASRSSAADSDRTRSNQKAAKVSIYKGEIKNAGRIGKGHEKAIAVGEKGLVRHGTVMAAAVKKPEIHMTSVEKMQVTRKGISKKALEELKVKSGFDYDQLSQVLGVARTTLLNKKGADKFPLSLSERIMSLAELYSFGYETFGDHNEFNQWISQPLPALGGRAPYDFLNNQFGREEVKNVIGRIAYGVLS